MEESKEFKKYWDLSYQEDGRERLSKEYTEELINLYNKYKDPRNKCTAAILLSHIEGDNRVPPILFDALDYWRESGYSGWISTSNSRLFNHYPDCRKQYLDLMFNGNFNQRYFLVDSLFFFQEKFRGFTRKDLNKILKDFIKKEKDKSLKRFIIFRMNFEKDMKFVENLFIKYDPLGLIKNGAKKDVYQSLADDIAYPYSNKNQAIQRIKKRFDLQFKKIPNDEVIEKIVEKIINKI